MILSTTNIHQQMIDKGFWSPEKRQLDFLSWKIQGQLLHVLIECEEWPQSEEDIEEAADICIVIADLLGSLGTHIELEDIMPGEMSVDYWRYVALAADQYRSTIS